MRRLGPIALGVVIVGVEFRVNALDALVDPLGWLLIAVGAWLLAARVSSLLALLTAPLSAAGAWLTYQMVLVDSRTGEAISSCGSDAYCFRELRFDDLGTGRALGLLFAALFGGAALVGILHILRTEVGDTSKQLRLRQQLLILEVAVPVVWSAPVMILAATAVISGDGYDPIWSAGFEPLGYARFAVMSWLAITVLVFADRYPRPVRRTPPGTAGP